MSNLTKIQKAQEEHIFFIENVKDAVNDSKKATEKLLELYESESEDFQKMRQFFLWANLNGIFEKWCENEDLPEEEQKEFEFEDLLGGEQHVWSLPA